MSREAVAMVEKSEERRESPRVPTRLLVRRADSGAVYEAHEGDVSLGGFAWTGSPLEAGAQVELRLKLPGAEAELHVRGEVLQVSESPRGPQSRGRFLDLPVEAELAIARYLDDVALADAKR
ncbi:PilZ domain-containing protein [Myxococcaceae bacterium GXIMD 01537]